jgi:hypothetical protein
MTKQFTLQDLRAAFIAGGAFERDTIDFDMEEIDEITELDFDDWVKNRFDLVNINTLLK